MVLINYTLLVLLIVIKTIPYLKTVVSDFKYQLYDLGKNPPQIPCMANPS